MFILKYKGMMEDNIKENGTRIKCMAMVCLLGKMEGPMMANTIWIKRRVMAYFTGRMEESTEAIGKMENRMEKALILIKKKLLRLEFG